MSDQQKMRANIPETPSNPAGFREHQYIDRCKGFLIKMATNVISIGWSPKAGADELARFVNTPSVPRTEVMIATHKINDSALSTI